MPNTLLIFSLGCIIGILFLWIRGIFTNKFSRQENDRSGYHDILGKEGMIKKIFSRENLYAVLLSLILIAIIILTAEQSPQWIYQGF